ncbi:MAG: T9SS type A sorting domain-containing protein [Bacteroidetes bacterium]|nr:T9SS type A sorting domain-containing protein [Bacteroidota bacterium]
MKFYKYTVILIALLISINHYAQEQLRPLGGNGNLPKTITTNSTVKKVATTTSIYLPFFDDFSYSYKSPYPSVNNWVDSNVYVNSGFAIAPISLGVATFDGLNKKGYPYNLNAAVNVSASADTLKSKSIHLDSIPTANPLVYKKYSPSDSIALTFYYQAEGFGEAPEPNDSLCLDFFKPKLNQWMKVWGKAGYNPSATDTNFYRVKIGIVDTAYFHDGFQFRFRNKGTTSGSLDHWNIDYIQVKDQYYYDDTLLNDASFAYKPSSFLKNYSVIPYRQYNQSLELATGFTNFLRNNFNIAKFSVYNYTITQGPSQILVPTDVYGTFPNPGFLPFENNGYYSGGSNSAARPIFSPTGTPFPTAPFTDSTYFTIKHSLTTPADVKNDNDTVVHIQRFSNYYAYDDGSAEQGYYLNTYGAKIALRYTLNVADTLKSVRIYFDPITQGGLILNSTFRINVWSNNGGSPGSVIYKDSLMYPEYESGSYNMIPTYSLTSCLPLGVGSYFIGIQQTTNQPLNIGFDRNTNHKNSLYYNISGSWSQSSINGSLMINPVMGCVDPPIIIGVAEHTKNNLAKIFPNPAQDMITVSYPGNQLEPSELEITTALGQTVFTKSITSNEQIDISNLSNGLYFIHLKGNSLNVSSQKLIISR